MARTRTFDPATALTQAVGLFAAKGYAETSMEDLVQATGVSRYGLYGTFGNKRDLFEQALEKYAERMGKQAFVRLTEPDAGLDDIRRLFRERVAEMTEDIDNKGCLFVHTAMEVAPRDHELRAVLYRFMRRMSKAFAAGLVSGIARGEIRADIDVVSAADRLTALTFGLAVLGRTGFSRAALDAVVDSTLGALAA